MSYRISGPDEFLAVTGMGVRSLKITKSAWIWPFQKCYRFSVQPHDYAMDLQAMTKEKLQFSLPVVFTVGPDVNTRGDNASSHSSAAPYSEGQSGVADSQREDRGDALLKYAMLLANSEGESRKDHFGHVANIVKGIIEGETRVLVSSMTMEEIFTEREVFKRRIFRNIQGELDQFGLKIYNANVKELKDAPGSVYFESLSRKAHEGAINQARVDVASAQQLGNIGAAERKGEEEREIAAINAKTAVEKTKRDIETAQAEAHFNTEQTDLDRDLKIRQTAAQRTVESRDEDLKKEVEIKRAAAEMERLRATDVVKAAIQRESKQQAADAAAYEVQAEARAQFDASQRDADAKAYQVRTEAEADNYAVQQAADAEVVRKLKDAEGVAAMAEAYGKMAQAFGGPAGLLQYMMIEKGTYVELAKANAQAVKGMEPKVSIWNTGSQAAGGDQHQGDGMAAMRNVYQMLPPLMTTIHEQTGVTLPEWQFGRLNAAGQAMNKEAKMHENS